MKPLDRVQSIAMIVAPSLLLVATGLFAADGSFYDSQSAAGIQFVAMAVMTLAVAGLGRLLAVQSPGWGAAGAAVAGLGSVAGAGFGIERMYTANGAPALESIGAVAPLYPLGLLFPLGMLLLGVGLARSAEGGSWPQWAGYAIAAGGVLFPVSRIGAIPPLGLVADGLLALGIVSVGAWALGWIGSDRRAPSFA